jgi:hypothetical protein
MVGIPRKGQDVDSLSIPEAVSCKFFIDFGLRVAIVEVDAAPEYSHT